MRGATPPIVTVSWWSIFQPTRPLRGATSYYLSTNLIIVISTHAPLAGRDEIKQLGYKPRRTFQPTRPLRGATRATEALRMCELYFTPRAPCGARLAGQHLVGRTAVFQPTRPLRGATLSSPLFCWKERISTHAPLAGRDDTPRALPRKPFISTHAPLAGRDDQNGLFLPRDKEYFNPRAPCGARRVPHVGKSGNVLISTHAPLAGRDARRDQDKVQQQTFQPTRPLRGATTALPEIITTIVISTHAPLAGRDHIAFNAAHVVGISTHAPLAGRDEQERQALITSTLFQPTRPLRGATLTVLLNEGAADDISTHAPLAGRDGKRPSLIALIAISTHAPLAGRDSKSVQITMHIFAITDKFQMLLHRMPPVRAFCSFLMQENHADFGCEPPR